MRRFLWRTGLVLVAVGAVTFVPGTLRAATARGFDCAVICPGGSCTASGLGCVCHCDGNYPHCYCYLAF